jgi:hypothetical protein
MFVSVEYQFIIDVLIFVSVNYQFISMFEMVYLLICLSEPQHRDRNREYTMRYLFLTNETAQFLFLAV